MKRMWAVCKKELKRYFSDYRMVLSLVLPGILIFILYSLMGNFLSPESINKPDPNYQYNIVMSDNYNDESSENPVIAKALDSLMEYQQVARPKYTFIGLDQVDENLEKLKNKQIDSLIVFDDNFEKEIILGTNPLDRPNVKVYFNSELKTSEILYSYITQTMNQVYAGFSINEGVDNPNLGQSSSMMANIMGVVLPMVTISLIYSVTLTICPESIAGEKERQTLSSILITPIKRHEFAIGKILALTLISLFGGVISGAALLLSLPKIMGGPAGGVVISASSYALIFFVLISLIVLFVNMATSMSTFAKTPKEAMAYLGPFVTIFMLLALIPSVADVSNVGFVFVPILGSCQAIYSIISGGVDILFLSLTIVANIIYSILFILLDVKLFKCESIVMRQ